MVKRKLLAVAIGLVLALMSGELAARVYYRLTHHIDIFNVSSLAPRHRLGWQGKQSIGDLASAKPRILVVGDSMTHGFGFAREEQLYYHVMGDLLVS